ncbi:MAG: ABC transporter ATP-binding protein [bacterium]|jgi:ABC-2 type transport system ATP-binding protein
MPILEFRQVNKVLKSGLMRRPVYGLGPLNLKVEAGEIFGYLGPNGAGKTTSIKLAMGILRPDSGEVRFFGRHSGGSEARNRVGFLPERPYFYQHLTAFELLDFYGELFGISGPTRRERAMRLLDMTGLKESAHTKLSKFSKGMLQRVGFAQALINDPEIVILDEPLSGLDPTGRRQIRDLVLGLRSTGKTVFFSSHVLQDVEMICDRVGILLNGKLLRAATMKDILSETLRYIEVVVEGLNGETLRDLGFDGSEDKAGSVFLRLGSDEEAGEAVRAISRAGGRITSMVPQRQTLEDYFMRNISEDAAPENKPPEMPRTPALSEEASAALSAITRRRGNADKVGVEH